MWFLFAASWLIGILIASFGRPFVPHSKEVSRGDALFLSFWAGLSVTLGGVYLFSLLFPVKYFGVALLLAAVLLRRGVARTLRDVRLGASPAWIAVFAAVQLALAWEFAKPTINYDTGLYHLQIMQWFRDYGSVPGAHLLHFRLAFLASWYALQGAFDIGPFARHTNTLLNYIVVSAGTAMVLVIVRRMLSNGRRPGDLFWLVFLACAVVFMPYEVHSTAADFPLALFSGAAGWTLLAAQRLDSSGAPAEARAFGAATLLLAAAAVSLKASGLFLLPVIVAAVALRYRATLLQQRRTLVAAALVLAAASAVSFTTTGCVVNNVAITCVDVPWGMGRTDVARLSIETRDFARHIPTSSGTPLREWLPAWSRQEPSYVAMLAAFGASLAALLPRRRLSWSHAALVVAALAGTAACFWAAPSARFVAPYVCLLPALAAEVWGAAGLLLGAIAVFGVNWSRQYWGALSVARPSLYALAPALIAFLLLATRRAGPIARSAALGVAALVLYLSAWPVISKVTPEGSESVWLLPGTVPAVPLREVRAGEVTVRMPIDDERCYDTPVPCSLYQPDPVELRDSAKGLGAGFRRKLQRPPW